MEKCSVTFGQIFLPGLSFYSVLVIAALYYNSHNKQIRINPKIVVDSLVIE